MSETPKPVMKKEPGTVGKLLCIKVPANQLNSYALMLPLAVENINKIYKKCSTFTKNKRFWAINYLQIDMKQMCFLKFYIFFALCSVHTNLSLCFFG